MLLLFLLHTCIRVGRQCTRQSCRHCCCYCCYCYARKVRQQKQPQLLYTATLQPILFCLFYFICSLYIFFFFNWLVIAPFLVQCIYFFIAVLHRSLSHFLIGQYYLLFYARRSCTRFIFILAHSFSETFEISNGMNATLRE